MLIKLISNETGIDPNKLEKIAVSASHRYKIYQIPKKTGGLREISHPSKPLKFLQRWLIKEVFSKLPVHDSVFSYQKKINILHNAKIHSKNNYLLRVDFKNFFPSLTSEDVEWVIKKNTEKIELNLPERDVLLIKKIVCLDGRLTIGAPSSPVLSNALLYEFDSFWYEECQKRNVKYSRYADDLFFSTKSRDILSGILEDLKKDLINRKQPKLIFNHDKTVFTSKKRKRVVTGLVLNSSNEVSIGREKKRKIRNLMHGYSKNLLNEDDSNYLKGYLLFAKSVEPKFIKGIEVKFPSEFEKLTTRKVYI